MCQLYRRTLKNLQLKLERASDIRIGNYQEVNSIL